MVHSAETGAGRPLGDRVAIVTGGGWNIGRGVALRLGRLGARVVVASRNAGRLRGVAAEIAAQGTEALAVACDVTEPVSVESMVARAVERFGAVDVLVAAAGGGGAHQAIDAVDPSEWCRVLAANLVGTFHCARAVLPGFRDRDRGDILVFIGGGALFPVPGQHLTAYATAKAGLCRFAEQLQAELLDTGIRVNCVEPGKAHHDRARSPEAAAELVEFLLTAPGAALRGRILSVNDDWWRDPSRVEAAGRDLHAYRLRRAEPG